MVEIVLEHLVGEVWENTSFLFPLCVDCEPVGVRQLPLPFPSCLPSTRGSSCGDLLAGVERDLFANCIQYSSQWCSRGSTGEHTCYTFIYFLGVYLTPVSENQTITWEVCLQCTLVKVVEKRTGGARSESSLRKPFTNVFWYQIKRKNQSNSIFILECQSSVHLT